MLSGKKILVGVTGSIAAYKAAFFVRLLVKSGCEVKVMMSESARDFISPLTLSTLSKNKVHSMMFDQDSGEWDNHVTLGMWADAIIIAPASAHTIAKMANGICDNLLLAVYLSAKCPVFFAPAMDLDMHKHPATQYNIAKLKSYDNHLIAPREGELASGLQGVGRMAEPEELIEELRDFFALPKKLEGKKILMTSGPTREAIDAVRFIGNNSTGKMGYHLAVVCARHGAHVVFVTGPVSKIPLHPNISVRQVTTADQMYKEASAAFDDADIAIFSSAVSDYKPAEKMDHKIKRNGKPLDIKLIENPDIAAELGKRKRAHQINVGFALETNAEETHARKKLTRKNLDLIVLNSLNDPGAGFSHDTNKISIYDKNNNVQRFDLKPKNAVASDVVKAIIDHMDV